MQWAIRQREPATGSRPTASSATGNTTSTGGGGSLIYIDPSNLRRSTTVTTATTVTQEAPVNMATTVSQLGRAFGIVVRQIADLLTMLQDYHALAPNLPRTLDISDQEASDLQVQLCFIYKGSWMGGHFIRFIWNNHKCKILFYVTVLNSVSLLWKLNLFG